MIMSEFFRKGDKVIICGEVDREGVIQRIWKSEGIDSFLYEVMVNDEIGEDVMFSLGSEITLDKGEK